jgi:hypothetical protein
MKYIIHHVIQTSPIRNLLLHRQKEVGISLCATLYVQYYSASL